MVPTPPTTGPTGTYGGANVGMPPVPSTLVTMVETFHVLYVFSNASAIDSNSCAWNGACGSASCPTICCLSICVEIDTGTWVSAANGTGTFGVGGAIGPGNAANAGYHGRPGTFTVP